jgi:Heterokaryon incompatibility protein (HET)
VRPIERGVATDAAFELARNWLDECNKEHPSCRIPYQHIQPLRIIEIQWGDTKHEPKLRLETNTGDLRYAALTYCWGDPVIIHQIMLNSQTHRYWLDDIPFYRLPKTLQDGIIATCKLGLRFLWIDCLCILQDDNAEMATEIAKMPHIYRGAYVTLSAARSRGSDEGFLHDIHVPSVNASIFKMAYACPDGRLGTILLFDDPVPQMEEPIDTRGWTLQEYLLSPRLLIYGIHGLRFSCRQGVQYDDEKIAEGSFSIGNNRKLALLREVSIDLEIARRSWTRLLVEYTGRILSQPEDRLLAISGIAKYYSEILNDEYLAGIWSRDLPAALMWENVSQKFPRPPVYRAPSWSWAAIDDCVEHFKQSEPVDPELSILSHAIQLADPVAPFGAVLSGSLNLKGRLKQALWDGDLLFSTTSPHPQYLASTVADTLESELFDEKRGLVAVWCLQIHLFDETRHIGPSGLILTLAKEGTLIFRRLGTFSFKDLEPENRDAALYSRLDVERREWSPSSKLEEIIIV